ncbi:divinyl chlorophyllide a 8-vinyl-reductase [Aureococcus anophagefferens]|uniref:Divinyl chlorophyllide a 8-vinyl-reductase n=2 Tax=Aureococcus anophagefferens TaxID=44056 RepID=A0ABR1FKT6_AURAN
MKLVLLALVASFGSGSALKPVSRRALGAGVASGVAGLAAPKVAVGAGATTVFVAGATGQTGRRVLERLVARSDVAPSAGVRNVDKAKKTLGEASTAVRGAMVQQVSAVDATGVDFKKLDVVGDDVATMAAALKGSSALVIATGFVPGNPLKMDSAAHAVDNLGTVALVDAAKAAGVKKVVLVSSILTNGRAWGQENSPGFQITNAFGHVLDEKIVAENYLRKSGLDYTIVRPGGLKAKPPTGPLVVAKEDTLNSGEVSRDLVADVCVAAVFDAKASNKVVEIIEKDGSPPAPVGGNIFAGVVLGVDAPVRNRVILFEDGATIEVKFHGRDSAGGLSAPLPFADCDEALFAVDHAMSMKFNHVFRRVELVSPYFAAAELQLNPPVLLLPRGWRRGSRRADAYEIAHAASSREFTRIVTGAVPPRRGSSPSFGDCFPNVAAAARNNASKHPRLAVVYDNGSGVLELTARGPDTAREVAGEAKALQRRADRRKSKQLKDITNSQ